MEWQTVKYQSNVPDELPAYLVDRRVPYGYESTGTETWFTCRMDPEPTARRVFWFHRPETLEPGDLLLNEASGSPNEVGKPAIWKGELDGCCFQNTLLRVRSKGPATDYLYWYCRSAALAGDFGEAGRGVNIRHLGKQGLASITLPLPPRWEQQRIVAAIEEHLSRLDAAERLLVAAEERVALLARSSMRSVFGSLNCTWTTLGEVADIRGGVTKDSGRQDDPAFVETPYLRVSNVQRGYLDLGEITTIRVHPTRADAMKERSAAPA